MNEQVLDASVVLKWFASPDEPGAPEARALRDRYAAGETAITVPSLLYLEVINIAARRWNWDPDALSQLAHQLDQLAFDTVEVELAAVAAWTARGLTAYDAAYVALAETLGLPLITDDGLILRIAGEVATPLSH